MILGCFVAETVLFGISLSWSADAFVYVGTPFSTILIAVLPQRSAWSLIASSFVSLVLRTSHVTFVMNLVGSLTNAYTSLFAKYGVMIFFQFVLRLLLGYLYLVLPYIVNLVFV